MADGLRRAGLRRAAEGRAVRAPPREPAFDLLERAPERAAVLLGMVVSLVAQAPYSPSATRVTERSQFWLRCGIACGNANVSEVLCAVYAAIALVALIATWSQNVAYFDNPGGFLLDFLNDSRVTPASRSLTVDTAVLAVLSVVMVGLTIWVDMG